MIMYFSATGNTKYCAEYIASKTGDNVVSMNDMMKNGITEIDCGGQKRIGIFAPVYAWSMAYAVSDFIAGLEFRNVPDDCYIYGVFTCGSSCGDCAGKLAELLSAKGLRLASAFSVIMPDNYVLLFPQKSDEDRRAMLERADTALREIADDILGGQHVFKLKGKIPRFMASLIQKFFVPSQRKVKGFTVNNDCIGCGLCAKVCPMNIITLKDNRPSWTEDKCACCLACLHRCPKHAINRGKSAKNGRYINPNVRWQ